MKGAAGARRAPDPRPAPAHAPARSVCDTLGMGAVLLACGLVLATSGTWSVRRARAAIAPAVQPGDPTRAAIDASWPAHARPGVRRVARSVVISIGWLVVAVDGLFLASTGAVLGGLP